jgi:hypothetical protein
MLGSALHGALEAFTEPMTRGDTSWNWEFLFACYVKSFQDTFGHDQIDDWFNEGRTILWNWYDRTDQQSDLQDVDIISREVKETFDVPYIDKNGQKQTVPCNYIIDRLDRLDADIFRVVDYKSQRAPLNPDELKVKIQPRLYALAVQIKYPQAREIWVQYDFLRYERVGTLFTRDDNVATWAFIKRELQRIVDADINNPPETLNDGCRYCPRKYTCATLQSNVRIGGIFSLDIDQMAVQYYEIKSQLDAIKSMAEDLEHQLLAHAVQTDQMAWEAETYKAKITTRRTRQVDRNLMADILGPDLMKDYGRLNVSDIDELRRDPRLTPAQASLLDMAITYKISDPSIKVTKK